MRKLTTLLPNNLIKATKQYALDHDTSLTAVVIAALSDFIQRDHKTA